MDTFTAIPSIVRRVINVIDESRYEEWLNSENLEAEVPKIAKIFVCYAKGPGCPVPIQIEVDGIETEYEAAIPTLEERGANGIGGTLTTNELVDKWRRANALLRRNLLLAVIKNLGQDDANVLANDDGEGRRILEELGWMAPVEPVNSTETETENKEEGEGETGESISSISPPSTQE